MSDELILERLQEIYEQKILTKQELTEEEISFINDNFEQMRDAGLIDDEMYSNYIVGSLSNPSFEFESSDTADALSELKDLEVWQQLYDSGDFTKYEILLNSALTDPNINLDDADRARLISELEDARFANLCMQNQEISGGCKSEVLRSVEEQEWASREEYFGMLYQLSQAENSGIDPNVLLYKIQHASQYRADEVENAHDNSYDRLLYMSAHDMKELDEFQKKDLINSLTDFEHIKSIVETEYEQFNLSNEERIDLIVRSGNSKYIDQILRGESDIDLGEHGLRQLVWQNGIAQGGDKDYYLQYANGEDYGFSSSDRLKFIMWSGDKDTAKEFLESNELNPLEQVQLLGTIGDRTYSEQFIERQAEPMKMYLRDQYINEMGSNAEKQEWNDRITTISDISGLSAEDLSKLPDDAMVKIQRSEDSNYLRFVYKGKICSNT